MRRDTREMKDPEDVRRVLDAAPVGRLATHSRGGYPIVKPVNFVRVGERIYVHSAPEGEKIEDIRRDDRVSFEVDEPLAYVSTASVPCRATYLFRSVIVLGRATLVADEAERVSALRALMEKHQPGCRLEAFTPKVLATTTVIRIDMEEAVGKEHLGAPAQAEAIRKAREEGKSFPLHLTESA